MTYPNPPPPPPTQSMQSNTVFILNPWFDPSYLKTSSGIVKGIIIVFSLISLVCIIASPFSGHGRGVYFCIVSILALIFTGCMLVMYLYHVVEKYHNIKWLKIELVTSVVLVFLHLTAATAAVAFGSPAYSTAGFFGYLTMVLYGVEVFLKLRAVKAGDLAQGHRTAAKQPHVITPPAMP